MVDYDYYSDFEKADEIYFRLGIIYKQQQKYQESLDVSPYLSISCHSIVWLSWIRNDRRCNSLTSSRLYPSPSQSHERRITNYNCNWNARAYSASSEYCVARQTHWQASTSGSRLDMSMSR